MSYIFINQFKIKPASRCIPQSGLERSSDGERQCLNTRTPVPTFSLNFQGNACCVAELNVGLLPWCQSEEMKILINNNLFARVGIEHTAAALQLHPCAPGPR